ncbi:MAG TPA: hypothetical protein VHL59_14070 [Thermoanaerobaculia bacterium]|nr:hypothetical protein [Thermoanaerobaculia bacterium]
MKTTIAAVLVSLVLCAPAHAQCGDNNDGAFTQQPLDWQTHFVALSRLGNHYMPQFHDGDSMTEPFWLTGGANPGFGSDGFRETWYIPRENLANTAALYRNYKPDFANHLDSWIAGEAGYTFEFTHGYPWTTQKAGTRPLTRYLNGTIFDHRLWFKSAAPGGYAVDAVMSSQNGVPRYGYERFGNLLDRCQTLAVAYSAANKLENATLRVEFNKIWGNAIGKITHKPTGRQIVDEDLGAMVQSTIFHGTSADTPTSCCLVNPTEAGGVDIANYGNTRRWAGSPILSTTAIGTSTRETVVKPMNFPFNAFIGTDRFTPLLWNGTFRKTVTLGYTAGSTTHNDVLRIVYGAKLDADASPAMISSYASTNLNNTFWLWRDQVAATMAETRVEVRNLTNNTVVQTYNLPAYFTEQYVCNDFSGPICARHRGLVMYSTNSSTLAYGVMRRDTADGPTAVKFMNWCNGGDSSCTFGRAEVVFDYFKFKGLNTSSYTSETVFLVVAAPATVRTRLRQIYCQETGACVP